MNRKVTIVGRASKDNMRDLRVKDYLYFYFQLYFCFMKLKKV